jgi:hypothetical protein
LAGSIYSVASLAADGSLPLVCWTEWCSFPWCSYPWPSREFFLIFCWRLRFSTRRSALALGCFSVDRIALDFTRPPVRHRGSARDWRRCLTRCRLLGLSLRSTPTEGHIGQGMRPGQMCSITLSSSTMRPVIRRSDTSAPSRRRNNCAKSSECRYCGKEISYERPGSAIVSLPLGTATAAH